MIAATVMFAVSSALAKWQVVTYSFAEVLFFRAVVSLVVCAALILPRTGLLVFRTARLRDHLGRSGTQAVAQSLIIIAFSLMPLAGAVAINFTSPLFATLFAVAMPIFGFSWPTGLDLTVMLVNGLFNALGQYWWTRSLSFAPPRAR